MQRTTRAMLIGSGLLAAAGTLAWAALGTPAAARPGAATVRAETPAIATMDSFRVLRAVLQSPEQVQAREQLAGQYQSQLQMYEQQDLGWAQEMETLNPNEARFQELMTQRQQLGQMYQQVAQQANMSIDQFSSQQAIEAFKSIRQAGTAVATELGYTHLMSSAGRYDELVGAGTTAAMQEILSRPVLMAPAEDDITLQVMNRLGVTDPAPPAEPAGGHDHDHDGHDHDHDHDHDDHDHAEESSGGGGGG